MQVKDSIEITANRTIDVLDNGLAYYNYEGNHFRLFATKNDALAFVENNDDSLVIKEFDDEESLDNYLKICYSIQKGTIVQNIVAAYSMEIFVNKFYTIERIDKDFIHFDNDISIFTIRNELFRNFRIISSIDDIVELESKALILKETFEQLKIMSESAEEEISHGALINETIAFLIQDEVYQGDEIELRFICDNMDITMAEQCSCCGKFISLNDECYEDDLNDGAALCDHCSVFDEGRDMYIKSVRQDVIEKITGLKFSEHIGNIGSTVEEFNHWLNRYKLAFSYSDESSKQNFIDFINGSTEFNICDCCGLIEKSTELNWDDENLFDDDYKNFRFLQGTNIGFDAVCDDCLNKVNKRTYLSLEDITSRLIENQMLYRVGDYAILENVDFNERKIVKNTIFGTIESLNIENKTYKLLEYPNIDFKDEEFFDNLNEAYVNKYTDFIADNYPEKSGEVDEWSYPNFEGHADIKMAFENYGYKNEFIEYLKLNNLPYDRFIDKDEEIIEELDEVTIVKNDILQKIFCIDADNDIVVPTFNELVTTDEYHSNWQLTEDYQNYSLPSIIQIVNEQTENFFTTLEVLNSHKEKFRKSKKYGFREIVEFGVPYEVVKELQRLHEIYDEKDLNDEPKMICLQANITTQDYSTIEVVLGFDIHESELLHYLKSTVSSEHYEEIDLLVEAIKEAKVDNHETLHIYDC